MSQLTLTFAPSFILKVTPTDETKIASEVRCPLLQTISGEENDGDKDNKIKLHHHHQMPDRFNEGQL